MSLFRRKKKKDKGKDKPQKKAAEGTPWISNAPAHWPTVVMEPLPAPNPKTDQEHAQNLLLFIVTVTKQLGEAVPGLTIASVNREYMFPWGFLNVPLEVEEGGKRYPIFMFEQSDEENAAKFAAAAEILPKKGVEPPIYYAPSPLPKAVAKNPLRPFNLDMITPTNSLPSGRYALWWATDDQPKFGGSKTMATLHEIYDALDGIYCYVFGLLALTLNLGPEKPERVALPDREATIPIKGPEYKEMFLSASREKGLRFHFNTDTCTPEYRDTFLALFLAFVKSFRVELEEAGHPKDPPDDDYEDGPRGWWRFAAQVAQEHEQTEGVQFFGVIEHTEEGQKKD